MKLKWPQELVPTVGGWSLVQCFALLTLFFVMQGSYGSEAAAWINISIAFVASLLASLLRPRFMIAVVIAYGIFALVAPVLIYGPWPERTVAFLFGLIWCIPAVMYHERDLPLGSRTRMWGWKLEDFEPSDHPVLIKD